MQRTWCNRHCGWTPGACSRTSARNGNSSGAPRRLCSWYVLLTYEQRRPARTGYRDVKSPRTGWCTAGRAHAFEALATPRPWQACVPSNRPGTVRCGPDIGTIDTVCPGRRPAQLTTMIGGSRHPRGFRRRLGSALHERGARFGVTYDGRRDVFDAHEQLMRQSETSPTCPP